MENPQVSSYIENAADWQQQIMDKLRSLIHQSVPGAVETLKWGRPVFTLQKDFAYLQANKNHVNLGFMNFHQIDDPNGILEGTGKDMRHIKMKSAENIDENLLKEWFVAVTT